MLIISKAMHYAWLFLYLYMAMLQTLKYFIVLMTLLILSLFSCSTQKTAATISDEEAQTFLLKSNDTIKIADKATEYEIIIIENGFDAWLASFARPENYYSQSYLENRNRIYVTEWNSRVLQPQRYNSNLYEMQIDYQINTDYGYEVNYKLYNYFIYFQRKYKQQLSGFIPRI